MTLLHAGAQLERAPGRRYIESLGFAELALRPPFPRRATLAQWRERLPAGFRIALVAPRATFISRAGAMRPDPDLDAAFEWLVHAADALSACAIVVPTGAEITTGQRDWGRLEAWFGRLPRTEGRTLVWAPAGLWEPPTATRQAERLGVVYGFDPLEATPPPGPILYGRLRSMGERRRFGEGLLYDVLDCIAGSEAQEAYVAIASPRAMREAQRLQQMASGEDAPDSTPPEPDALLEPER